MNSNFGYARTGGNPPLPHQAQAHFYGAPEIEFGALGPRSGIKAGDRNSLHGGSARTGGYGHGRAVDVTGENDDAETVWKWLDAHGAQFGLHRPMPGYDPAHVQSKGEWRQLASSLRKARAKLAQANANGVTPPANAKVANASK